MPRWKVETQREELSGSRAKESKDRHKQECTVQGHRLGKN